jgi:hypothetical protein
MKPEGIHAAIEEIVVQPGPALGKMPAASSHDTMMFGSCLRNRQLPLNVSLLVRTR